MFSPQGGPHSTVTLTSTNQEAKGVLGERLRPLAEIPCFALARLLNVSTDVFEKCLDQMTLL